MNQVQTDHKQQRANAEVQAHLWLCSIMLVGQLWIYSNAHLLEENGAATWWSLALSVLVGAAVVLPTWLLVRMHPGEDLCGAIRTALGKWAGGAVCVWLGVAQAADAAICVFALVSLCSEYLLQLYSVRTLALLTAIALLANLVLGEELAAGRLAYLLRKRLILGFTLFFLSLLPNANFANLHPMVWHGILPSSGKGLLAGSSCCALFALGFITPRTNNQAPAQKALPCWVVLCGGVLMVVLLQFGIALTLSFTTSFPNISWAERIFSAADFLNRWGAIRATSVIFQVGLLMVAAQGALAYGQHAIAFVRPGKSKRWAQALLGALMLVAAWYYAPSVNNTLLALTPWRIPIVLVPLWIACGAGALRKKKGANA